MTLGQMQVRVAKLLPDGAEMAMVDEVLCSEEGFAVVLLADGRVASLWAAHGSLWDSEEALLEAQEAGLNRYERSLLAARKGGGDGA